jgi:hypothetical protein
LGVSFQFIKENWKINKMDKIIKIRKNLGMGFGLGELLDPVNG